MPYEDSSAEVRQRVLCSTGGVTACDVLARGLRRGVIDVEPQAFDRLILPVRGLFMQHESATRQRVATPNHALLVTSNAPFRVSYLPNASDQCLVLCWSASARDDAEVGTSVYDYVLRTRLTHALERVLDGDSDLTTIALDTGFSTHSHFTSRFRTTFGLRPGALRVRGAAAS